MQFNGKKCYFVGKYCRFIVLRLLLSDQFCDLWANNGDKPAKNRLNTKTLTFMKTTVKKATKALTIIEATTNTGKKCFAVLTDLRLSKDDFKSLMADIQIAEGYGFVKYFAEHKKRLVSAVNIDRPLFESLVSQYEWKPAEPKETKKAGKATNKTKQKKETATGEETPSIDPALLAQFLQFQKMLKK